MMCEECRGWSTVSVIAAGNSGEEMGICSVSFTPFVGSHVPHVDLRLGAWVIQAQSPAILGDTIRLALNSRVGELELKARARATVSEKVWARCQYAVLAASGWTDCHTGKYVEQVADVHFGTRYVVVGNRLNNALVLNAAAAILENRPSAMLEDNLLRSTQAACQAGGDRLGHRSCALVVKKRGKGLFGSGDLYLDLRVEDTDEPLEELKRLVNLRRAFLLEQGA